MLLKDFIKEAKKRGLSVGSLSAEDKQRIEAASSFDEVANLAGSSEGSSKKKENPKEIYETYGPIQLAYNDSRDMGFLQAGNIIKEAVYGLVPKMFELNLTGPTFYKNEHYQAQISKIFEVICKYLRRNVNYTENDLLRFITNNITLCAIYYLLRRKYGFSQFVTDDCPEFKDLWAIEYNHELSAGLYTDLILDQDMLNPSGNDKPATSDWNRIDTTALIKEIEDKKYWVFAPKNISTLFKFWFDNVYILDDDYHNRKFSFANVTSLDWLDFDDVKKINVNRRINVSNINVRNVNDLLQSMIKDPIYSNIRADIANAEEKGMVLQFDRTVFSMLDYVANDHLVKSKTYVQALTNAYTNDVNVENYNNDNFIRVDWIDEDKAGDPYTALLLLGQFAKGISNTNVIGFQAVNYVMRIYAAADHVVDFMAERTGLGTTNTRLSSPSVYIVTSNSSTTATVSSMSTGFAVTNDGSSGDTFNSGSRAFTPTVKAYAKNADYTHVTGFSVQDISAPRNAFNCDIADCDIFPDYIEVCSNATKVECDNIVKIASQTIPCEVYAGNIYWLSQSNADSPVVKGLIAANATKVWFQFPVAVIPEYDSNLRDLGDSTPIPSKAHILCYSVEWDFVSKAITHQHYTIYTFNVAQDITSSVRYVKSISNGKMYLAGFGLVGELMNSCVAFPTDAKLSDETGDWRTNSTPSFMKAEGKVYATDSAFLTAIANEPGYVGRYFGNDGATSIVIGNITFDVSNAPYLVSHIGLDYATIGGNARFTIQALSLGSRRITSSMVIKDDVNKRSDYAFFGQAPSFTRDFPVIDDATGFVILKSLEFAANSDSTSAGNDSIDVQSDAYIVIDNVQTNIAPWFFMAAGYCIPIYSTEVVRGVSDIEVLGVSTNSQNDTSSLAEVSVYSTVLFKEDFVPFLINRSELGLIYKDMIKSLTYLIDFENMLK